jgi:hypothetical protein
MRTYSFRANKKEEALMEGLRTLLSTHPGHLFGVRKVVLRGLELLQKEGRR